jgi:4'-phosphopantetheinyl transferase
MKPKILHLHINHPVTVMLYIFDNIDTIDNHDIATAYSHLSAQRREYVDRFRMERDRQLCIIAYQLLMAGLRREYAIVRPVEFDYTPTGKPILRDYPAIHFNVSHCRRGVACAISDSEVGIDIEEIRPFDRDVAAMCCNDRELADVLAADNSDLAFTSLWTRKESLVKMTGKGIASGLKTVLDDLDDTTVFAGYDNPDKRYCCTLCHCRPLELVRYNSL